MGTNLVINGGGRPVASSPCEPSRPGLLADESSIPLAELENSLLDLIELELESIHVGV